MFGNPSRLEMTPQARKVMRWVVAVWVVMFVSFLVHLFWLGTSAFPGGYVKEGRYLVEDHGRIVELSAGQFWWSYAHGMAMALVAVVGAGVILWVYARGGVREERC